MAFLAEEALQYLVNAHRTRRMPHSLLVSGEEGSGKRRVIEGFFAAVNGQLFHRQRQTVLWSPRFTFSWRMRSRHAG